MADWSFANSDRTVTLQVRVNSLGGMQGSLTVAGSTYLVFGNWAANYAGGTGTLRPYSAFALSGWATVGIDPSLLVAAACGIITGPGDAPTRIDMQVDTCAQMVETAPAHYPQMELLPT